jgi:hypothetical protein
MSPFHVEFAWVTVNLNVGQTINRTVTALGRISLEDLRKTVSIHEARLEIMRLEALREEYEIPPPAPSTR